MFKDTYIARPLPQDTLVKGQLEKYVVNYTIFLITLKILIKAKFRKFSHIKFYFFSKLWVFGSLFYIFYLFLAFIDSHKYFT